MSTPTVNPPSSEEGIVYNLRRWGGKSNLLLHIGCIVREHDISTRPILTMTILPENSFNPMILATLIAAQNLQPFRPLPMLFPPMLVFSSFISLHEYKKDGGGLLAAQSGLYMLLALRRKQVSFFCSG
jgi:hypothetical protein